MTAPLELIVGLGNPGANYANTRHNAGAWLVEKLAMQEAAHFKLERKFFGRLAAVTLSGHPIRLLLPDTYMNESGKSVAALVNFYKIPLESVLIAHDELDLVAGQAQLKQGGGLAGHNGLRDIARCLGAVQSFKRLRIGVSHPGDRQAVTGYLLGQIGQDDRERVDQSIAEALRVLPRVASDDWQGAMHQLHSTPQPPG